MTGSDGPTLWVENSPRIFISHSYSDSGVGSFDLTYMLCAHVLTSQQSYIRPLFDRRILWYGVRCPSVRPSVRTYVASSTILVGRIYQELCAWDAQT